MVESRISTDEYLKVLDEALSGKIGPQPTGSYLETMHTEAEERFKNKIPPGYADQKQKTIPECYGDYIAWKQLIDIASEKKCDVILATDDAKDNWWRREQG